MKKIGISLLGLDDIGTSTYKILTEQKEFYKKSYGVDIEVECVLEEDKMRISDFGISKSKIAENMAEICSNPEIDAVVVASDGLESARTYALTALKSGKCVITANAELCSRYSVELEGLAKKNNCGLFYGACFGGLPVIRVLSDCLQANIITAFTGILDSAYNYALTLMNLNGKSYCEALDEAQKLGFIIDDDKSACKLSLLSKLAFHCNTEVADIYIEQIEGIEAADIALGKSLGFVLKPLVIGKNTEAGVELRIHAAFIKESHPLASVNGSSNGIHISRGAVGGLTICCDVSDTMSVARALAGDVLYYALYDNGAFNTPKYCVPKHITNFESAYYVRMSVKDRAGVLAKVSSIFNKNGVSLSAVRQESVKSHGEAALVLITHKARENTVKKILREIDENGLAKVASVIKVTD